MNNAMIRYRCRCGKDEWEGRITYISEQKGYLKLRMEGRGSAIYAYAGSCEGELWICLPYQGVGCTLARPDDVFWNSERLADLMNSTADGITVAEGIRELGEYLEN